MAASSAEGTMRVRNLRGQSPVIDLPGAVGRIGSICFNSDDSLLAGTTADGTVVVWDLNKRAIAHRLAVSARRGEGTVRFGPRPGLLTVHSRDGGVGIWSLAGAAPRPVATLYMFPAGGWGVISPAGPYDSSDGGRTPGLHWVSGTTTLPVDAFRKERYRPGLLRAVLDPGSTPTARGAGEGGRPGRE